MFPVEQNAQLEEMDAMFNSAKLLLFLQLFCPRGKGDLSRIVIVMLITAVLENKQGTKDGDQLYVDISSNWAQFRVLVSVDDFKKRYC